MQDLIKKHSEFISYPISLWVEQTTEKEVDDDEEESSAPKEDEEEGKIEEVRLSICAFAPRITACGPRQRTALASYLPLSPLDQGSVSQAASVPSSM